jgi:hypothetical protein
MPRIRRTAKPDPWMFEASLRELTPQLNLPIIGTEAIRQWLYAHGFHGRGGGPPSWRSVKHWQQRCGEPMMFHSGGSGKLSIGCPTSTVLVLTRWAMCQSHKIQTRIYTDWVPHKAEHRRQEALKRRLARKVSVAP